MDEQLFEIGFADSAQGSQMRDGYFFRQKMAVDIFHGGTDIILLLFREIPAFLHFEKNPAKQGNTREAIALLPSHPNGKKPLDNLVTMEWQHATADFNWVIRIGVRGIREKIAASKAAHTGDREKTELLDALGIVADAFVEWAHKCSDRALAEEAANPEHKKNLMQLAETLKNIPEEPASSFYEAVLAIYLFFQYDPDSLGTLDRTLYDFYRKDLAEGVITPEQAKAYLQELFLMIQARVPMGCNFTRDGESHFCVGGMVGGTINANLLHSLKKTLYT